MLLIQRQIWQKQYKSDKADGVCFIKIKRDNWDLLIIFDDIYCFLFKKNIFQLIPNSYNSTVITISFYNNYKLLKVILL